MDTDFLQKETKGTKDETAKHAKHAKGTSQKETEETENGRWQMAEVNLVKGSNYGFGV